MENNLKTAYSEIYEILNLIDNEHTNKIPIKVKELIINEKDSSFRPNILTNIPLEKQKLQKETFTILTILYLNYWCESESEKQEIINLCNNVDILNREKYSYDNLFKKNKKIAIQEVIEEKNNSLVEYKESIFAKILNRIKKIFLKNK